MTNILISALVALVVSLGTEWFAKPWLEARKDRILKRQQALQDTLAAAKEEAWRMEISVLELQEVYKPDLRREFIAARSRVPRIANKRNREALEQITNIMIQQTPAPEHGNTRSETRALVEAQVLGHAVALLETPVWRFRKRQQIYIDFIIEAGLAPH